MSIEEIIILSILIFAAAILYSSVGHGGASGYLAAMALFGLTPVIMKPTGLVLNILVSSIAIIKFYQAKYFSWSIFLPITLSAMPFSFLGGALSIPGTFYKVIAGIILLFGVYRLFRYKETTVEVVKKMPIPLAVILGAGIGFLSGLVGVGGGIFLSPLLLFMGWATSKQTSGISAAFILVNSISGLLGSTIGSTKASNVIICRILGAVLTVAGVKLIFV